MFEILSAGALLLLVQPAAQQPASVNGIQEATVAIIERALESSLEGGKSAKTIRLRTERPSGRRLGPRVRWR
jgi:hypothetical protein